MKLYMSSCSVSSPCKYFQHEIYLSMLFWIFISDNQFLSFPCLVILNFHM